MHETQLSTKNDSFLKEFNFRRHWKHASAVLSCFVVLGTLSALTLPAVTMNQPAVCGKEEHIHTDSCYMVPEEKVLSCNAAPHIHDSGCYGEAGNLLCGQADFFLHTHDDLCYDTDGNLVCQLPEISEHAHSDDCYIQTEITVEEGHQHTDDCFSQVPSSEPACGLEDTDGHTHSEGCSITESILTCELTEDETHTHDDSCYETVATLTCTEAEAQAHHHEETCFPLENGQLLCEMEECDPVVAPGEPELICTETEIIQHIHVETCLDNGTYLCGQTEIPRHSHTESCFCDAAPVLICEAEAHTHEDMCYSDPNADLETPEIWESSLPPADTFMGIWSQDLIFVAESQIGYTESVHNFVLDEDGSHKGYSRYGAWYGEPYADWNPLFLSFCLHYAGIPEEAISRQSDLTLWQEEFTEAEAWYSLADCIPVPGDLIFLDLNEDGVPDQAGIFTKRIEGTTPEASLLCIILGDKENAVIKQEYKTSDPTLLSCVSLDKLHSNWEASQNPTDPTEPGETVPEETLPVETPPGTLSAQGDGYSFTLTCPAEAALPEGTTLQAQALASESETYQTLYSQLPDLLGDAAISSVWMYDITLQAEQAAVEPAAPVTVELTLREAVPVQEGHHYLAVHFGPSGPEILSVEAIVAEGLLTGFRHTQDSFSPTAYVEIIPNPNPTEVGPDPLNVDYYVFIDGTWELVGSTKTGWLAPAGSTGWNSPDVRDAITLAQIESIFGKYGFDANASNAVRTVAYHRRVTSAVYSDTDKATRDGYAILPLSRDADYNLYYLPNLPTYSGLGTDGKLHSTETTALPTAENAFYTVSVLDANHIVYTEDEATPESQTILVNTTATLKVKTGNAGWQWVGKDGTVTEATGTVNSDGTTTYTSPAVTQTLYLMPVSSVLDGATASQKTVHWMVYLDDNWTEVGTTSVIYKKSGVTVGATNAPRWFVTSDQAYSILSPYGFNPAKYTYTSGTSNSFAHQAKGPDLAANMYTDNESTLLSDQKTWAIGLSYSEQDYTIYYVPSYAGKPYWKSQSPDVFGQTPSNLDGSRFYSISVRDDDHLVYASEELEGSTVVVPEGSDAVFTVHNADGVLWSSTGQVAEPEQADNKTTFSFTDIRQKIEVVATYADPGFTVQYYANIEQYDLHTSGNLSIIDTSGKKLPQNGTTPALKYLQLNKTSTKTDQNNGIQTALHSVNTTKTLIKLYTESEYTYEESPSLKYFDKLYNQSNYKLSAVCVLKENKSSTSTNTNDWWWYLVNDAGTNVSFTNIASEEKAPREEGKKQPNTNDYCILLQNNTIIRLQYEATTHSYSNQATFFDYDISRGESGGYVLMRAVDDNGSTGINSASNYHASGDGNYNWSIYGDGIHTWNYNNYNYKYWCENMYAFGNSNCSTGVGKATWNGQTLNKFNDGTFKGCTFGLVTGLDANDNIVWDSRITTPNVFSEGISTGKTDYPGGSLTFKQVGDTYTLTAANSTVGSRTGLEYFFNPAPGSTIIFDGVNNAYESNIFTNNFWVVDNATNRKDGNWGRWGTNAGNGNLVCDKMVKGWTNGNNYIQSNTTENLPLSDDGRDHNWFFGMEFALTFTLTEDYVGPLHYIFFGDDDMWVFLDGKLICDIGGVHSSVGEYVDLRDYLPNGSSGQHTLKFFYTERGASGSTCWMSFTLPAVSASVTSQDTGSLCLEKSVQDMDGVSLNSQFSNYEYDFTLALKTAQNGSALPGTYSFTRVNASGKTTYGTVHDGSTLSLRAGDKITVSGLPTGSWYSITETADSRKGYIVTVNGGAGYVTSGKIETGKNATASFVNKVMAQIPNTGGAGTLSYTFSGLSLMGLACLMYSHTRKRRKGGT